MLGNVKLFCFLILATAGQVDIKRDCQPKSTQMRQLQWSYYNLDLYVKNEVVNININEELHQDSDGWIPFAYKHVGGENKALVRERHQHLRPKAIRAWLNDLGLTAADVDSVRFYFTRAVTVKCTFRHLMPPSSRF